MTVLLDTHVWIWWLIGSEKLSRKEYGELDRLASRGNLGLAAVSLWEAQMLHAKGRLTIDRTFDAWIRDATAASVIKVYPLDVEVVIALNGLPKSFHGDPADRLIVATARAHDVLLATHDTAIRRSRVATIWKPA